MNTSYLKISSKCFLFFIVCFLVSCTYIDFNNMYDKFFLASFNKISEEIKNLPFIEDIHLGYLDISSLNYVSDTGFNYIFDIFSNVDFIKEFNYIDDDISNYFLYKYYQLFFGEKTVFIPEMNINISIDELLFPSWSEPNHNNFRYQFLDFSGDGYPELSIRGNAEYIIRYVPDKKMFYLWYTPVENTWFYFIAPNRMTWGGGLSSINHIFVIMTENAIPELKIHFFTEAYSNPDDEIGIVNLVSLPFPLNEIYIPEYLENQAIRFENNPAIYFRVTLEQFRKLKKDYDYLRLNPPIRMEFHELFKNIY